MLEHYRILTAFAQFAGLPEEEAMRWRTLCDSAGAQLAYRLHAQVDVHANMERLCTAAAGLAYANYLELSSGAADEVRVGDIALRASGNAPGKLRMHWLEQVSDLLAPQTFAFVQTGEAAT